MKMVFALMIVISSGALLFAQDTHSVDCAKFNSPACTSFNEMLSKGDDEISNAIKTDTAFVCFREYEDAFLIISFQQPIDRLFRISTPNISTQSGMVWYLRFKDGVSDDEQVSGGKWKKLQIGDTPSISFASEPGRESSASINDSEVTFSYTFKNLSGTKTEYSLQIRRSTMRFHEIYQWPHQVEEKGKGTKPEPATPSEAKGSDRSDNSGYCTRFN